MVKEAVLRNQKSVGLEGTLQTSERFHPLLSSTPALLLAKLAPAVDLHVVAGLHDIGDVPLRIHLFAVLQNFDLVLFTRCLDICVRLPLA